MRDTGMDEGRNEKVRGDFIVLLRLYRSNGIGWFWRAM
jgi:hypothetical protein